MTFHRIKHHSTFLSSDLKPFIRAKFSQCLEQQFIVRGQLKVAVELVVRQSESGFNFSSQQRITGHPKNSEKDQASVGMPLN